MGINVSITAQSMDSVIQAAKPIFFAYLALEAVILILVITVFVIVVKKILGGL